MEKRFAPIRDKDEYHVETYKVLLYALWDNIYADIFKLFDIRFPLHKKWQSVGDLKSSLVSGRVVFWDDWFFGQFNAGISKGLRDIGAKFNKTRKGFKLAFNELPVDIRESIIRGRERARQARQKALDLLDEKKYKRIELPIRTSAEGVIRQMNIDTKKVLPETLEVPKELNKAISQSLSKDYFDNLELEINDWKNEAVDRLRSQIDKNVDAGFRAETMIDAIKAEYGVSESKAKFLAKQETSLLVSAYRKARYEEIGIHDYIWSSSHDARVRPRHKELDGYKFTFDNPPVVDTATGRKANPGEDFGCRCVAIPVLDESELLTFREEGVAK